MIGPQILRLARHSVIYGLGGSVQDAMKFSKYGINAVFNEPLERPAALKLVRATQMLVLHEFRRTPDRRVEVLQSVKSDAAETRTVRSITRDDESATTKKKSTKSDTDD